MSRRTRKLFSELTPEEIERIDAHIRRRMGEWKLRGTGMEDIRGILALAEMLPDGESRRILLQNIGSDTSNNMDGLPGLARVWIDTATRGLCEEARERITRELSEHYLASVERLMANGADRETAEERALDQLGSPVVARREFRRANLTTLDLFFLQSHVEKKFSGKQALPRAITVGYHTILLFMLAALTYFLTSLMLERPERYINLFAVCFVFICGSESIGVVCSHILNRLFTPRDTATKCAIVAGLNVAYIGLIFAAIVTWRFINFNRTLADEYDFVIDLTVSLSIVILLVIAAIQVCSTLRIREKLRGRHLA